MNDTIAGNTPPNAGNTMPDAGEFTPGPWATGDGYSFATSVYAGTMMVAFAREAPGRIDWPTARANARLIAAAPELLTELEYAVKLLAPFGETAQVQRMRQVIAKARGE